MSARFGSVGLNASYRRTQGQSGGDIGGHGAREAPRDEPRPGKPGRHREEQDPEEQGALAVHDLGDLAEGAGNAELARLALGIGGRLDTNDPAGEILELLQLQTGGGIGVNADRLQRVGHGAGRDVEDLGDLGVVQAEHVAQHDGGPVLGRELVERIVEDSEWEKWFSADEAKEYGIVDHVVTSAQDVSGGGGMG